MEMIKTRAIVQYIQPFSSVSLSTMSTAISTPLHQVLAEVERLVEKRLIQGRIDLIDQAGQSFHFGRMR
jgi:COP9 signalosome complex subunit 1